MRIQTGFEIIVWVETSFHVIERVSRVRNYYKLQVKHCKKCGVVSTQRICENHTFAFHYPSVN